MSKLTIFEDVCNTEETYFVVVEKISEENFESDDGQLEETSLNCVFDIEEEKTSLNSVFDIEECVSVSQEENTSLELLNLPGELIKEIMEKIGAGNNFDPDLEDDVFEVDETED